MITYKLFRIRRDGTLGSLFINRKQVIPLNKKLEAEAHKTKGFAFRPGWHVTAKPVAPHLSMKGRAWYKVRAYDCVELPRPAAQGGLWYIAGAMKVLGPHIVKE